MATRACGVMVDPVEGLTNFLPHGVVHRIRFLRPVEADFGDAVGEAQIQGGESWQVHRGCSGK
jgi:hypothetical protein